MAICNFDKFIGSFWGWDSQTGQPGPANVYVNGVLQPPAPTFIIQGIDAAYEYYSTALNGLTSTPQNMITFDPGGASTTQGVGPCIYGASGNQIRKFNGINFQNPLPPGMGGNVWGPTSSWDDVLNDFINLGNLPAVAGMNSTQLESFLGNTINKPSQHCTGCGCCGPGVWKEIRDQILTPVYHDLPGWGQAMNLNFIGFMNDMYTGYMNDGCSVIPGTLTPTGWWADKVALWNSQLPGLSGGALALKTAKIAFAQAMHNACCCPGTTPQFTGGGSSLAPPIPSVPKTTSDSDDNNLTPPSSHDITTPQLDNRLFKK